MKPYNLILAFGLTISAVPATAAENDYKAFADQQAAAFMANTLVQDALAANNSAHAAYTEADILALDSQWREQLNLSNSPLIAQINSAPVSDYLRQVVADSDGAIVEIILMDNVGLNAGISAITSDFWQGDEDKFLKTYTVGAGSIHAGDVELDESSGIYVMQVSIPILDPSGQLVGAATFSLDAERL
ncbi:MAG: hypothetical protein ACI9U6_000883 [Loktanella salsilacus]|jgi:hypothetical protein|uniref:Cache domain-containing protein n=1 Tax=Loktanella salsilacus TaxID=195913 RepID=A0A1I4CZS6_9RHOB|nr:PDC sensor domain-containing protein [Loktanella salsilacus]SFK85717.1 hypothetical protein SAMN04488004_10366 [Loktanella salsilacus]